MAKILIIGGGFAGCIAADMLLRKNKGHKVTLIERSNSLGGSCITQNYGGHPYTLGPRHFLTRKEWVFDFLNEKCPMRRYDNGHEFLTYVERDQKFYHFPIHEDEIQWMPDADAIKGELAQRPDEVHANNLEDYWIQSVGPTLYSKFIDQYSRKMWGINSNTEITDFGFTPKGVALNKGKKAAWSDAISGFPLAINGYNDYFGLATADVEVQLNTNIEEYDFEKVRVKVKGNWISYDIIISTISPEIPMRYAFGELRWAGRDFFKLVLPMEHVFPKEVYFLYYANDEAFTRIVEYKKFYKYESATTLIGIEIPSKKNKLYPYPCKADQELHAKYISACNSRVLHIGRNGAYRYLDVGMIIEQCADALAEL
jgi:UDP-galactopyranose mutase